MNLSREAEPPDFDAAVEPFRRKVGRRHGTAQLKVGERVCLPMHANWKLALENFLECYHCGPSHEYLCHVHPGSDLTVPGERAWWAEDYISGTMDGKPTAPLLPAIKRVRVTQSETATGFSSSYWLGYDDYVLAVRFTPRDADVTAVECLWLVHPDAERGVHDRALKLGGARAPRRPPHQDVGVRESRHIQGFLLREAPARLRLSEAGGNRDG